MSGRSYLSIGDVLTLLRQEFPDVTISKIRFLESQGLVNPERTPSGYRKFYEDDVERLRWVLRQQREHFLPLKVIKDRLDDGTTSAGWVAPRSTPAGSIEPPATVAAAEGAGGAGGDAAPAISTVGSHQQQRGSDPEPVLVGHGAGAMATSLGAGASPERPPASSPAPSLAGPATSTGSVTPPASSVSQPSLPGSPPLNPVLGTAPDEGESSTKSDSRPRSGGVPGSGSGGERAHRASPGRDVTPGRPGAAATAGPPPSGPASGPTPTAPTPTAPTPLPPTLGASSLGTDPATARGSGPTPPPARPDQGGESTGASLTLHELAAACGLDVAVLEQLREYGLLAPTRVGGAEYYDEEALAVSNLAAGFARYGVEPRHLRLYKNAAEREAGFVEQIVLPLVRQRNPEARTRAHETADELTRLGQGLRSSLLRRALRDLLGG